MEAIISNKTLKILVDVVKINATRDLRMGIATTEIELNDDLVKLMCKWQIGWNTRIDIQIDNKNKILMDGIYVHALMKSENKIRFESRSWIIIKGKINKKGLNVIPEKVQFT